MNEPMPRDYTYAMAIAALLVEENRNKRLWGAKFDAIHTVFETCERYGEESFDSRVVDTIMEKKAQMILDATSVQDVKEIALPPKPRYDGRNWHLTKNNVSEEEMICWAIASTRATLVREACERYLHLLEDFYGKEALRSAGIP